MFCFNFFSPTGKKFFRAKSGVSLKLLDKIPKKLLKLRFEILLDTLFRDEMKFLEKLTASLQK